MKKIQYSVYKRETGSAGGKAKNDCYDILIESGFLPSYKPRNSRISRIISQWLSIKLLGSDSELIVQYPTVSKQIMPVLLKKLQKIKHSIAIVHDIPAIQGQGGLLSNQIEELNHFEFLIVHNDIMKDYLTNSGCKSKMVSLGAFDYLCDANRPVVEHSFDGTICFAGNLDKSKFLLELDCIKKHHFNLYGIKNSIDLSEIDNTTYCGLLKSDEIPYLLEGDYGLVWDGESIDECSGIHGRYLKVNNPHKMSLYIVAEKPIITWKEAAIAHFIESNGLGITVNSLKELNSIDLASDYERMKKNVINMKKKISTGYFLKKAVGCINDEIYPKGDKS